MVRKRFNSLGKQILRQKSTDPFLKGVDYRSLFEVTPLLSTSQHVVFPRKLLFIPEISRSLGTCIYNIRLNFCQRGVSFSVISFQAYRKSLFEIICYHKQFSFSHSQEENVLIFINDNLKLCNKTAIWCHDAILLTIKSASIYFYF